MALAGIDLQIPTIKSLVSCLLKTVAEKQVPLDSNAKRGLIYC